MGPTEIVAAANAVVTLDDLIEIVQKCNVKIKHFRDSQERRGEIAREIWTCMGRLNQLGEAYSEIAGRLADKHCIEELVELCHQGKAYPQAARPLLDGVSLPSDGEGADELEEALGELCSRIRETVQGTGTNPGAPATAGQVEYVKNALSNEIKAGFAAASAGRTTPDIRFSTPSFAEGDFIPRPEYSGEIVSSLEAGRIAFICGLPGCGKSTLAQEAAAGWAELHPRGHCAVVTLPKERDEACGLDDLLDSVPIHDRYLLGPDVRAAREKAEDLLRSLEDEDLIVVDNYNAESPSIREFLERGLKCRVVVTTWVTADEVARDGQHALEIPCDPDEPASLAFACDLFMRKLGRKLRDDEAPVDVEAIARAVECHALAIVAIAGQVARERNESLHDLAGELKRDLEGSLACGIQVEVRRTGEDPDGLKYYKGRPYDALRWVFARPLGGEPSERERQALQLLSLAANSWVDTTELCRLLGDTHGRHGREARDAVGSLRDRGLVKTRVLEDGTEECLLHPMMLFAMRQEDELGRSYLGEPDGGFLDHVARNGYGRMPRPEGISAVEATTIGEIDRALSERHGWRKRFSLSYPQPLVPEGVHLLHLYSDTSFLFCAVVADSKVIGDRLFSGMAYAEDSLEPSYFGPGSANAAGEAEPVAARCDYLRCIPGGGLTRQLSFEAVERATGCEIVSIGDGAFFTCSALESVEIPASVSSVGDLAFFGCSALESVEIPASVSSIGVSAFCDCSALASVDIPASVTSIGVSAFYSCSALESISVSKGSRAFSSSDGVLYDKHKKELLRWPSGKKGPVDIPASVTSIGDGAFSDCSALESVEIPASVTSVGDLAFCGCSALESVEIPASVTSIGDRAFSDCSALASVEIPASVSSIGVRAFFGCSALASVEIPASVTSVGDGAFYGCSALASVEIPASVSSIGKLAFVGCSQSLIITVAGRNPAFEARDGLLYDRRTGKRV